MWPRGMDGVSSGRIISLARSDKGPRLPDSRPRCPVTVRQSPSSSPSPSRYFIRRRDAAGAVQILLDILAAGLHVRQQGHPVADLLEVVHARGTSTARAMAIRCSTALVEPAQHGDDHQGIFEGLAGHDIPRPDVLPPAGSGWPRPRGGIRPLFLRNRPAGWR
jgi:hypothetical protein